MTVLLKLIYGIKAIPVKIPAVFFAEANKLILNFILKFKGTRIAKNNIEKEEQS